MIAPTVPLEALYLVSPLDQQSLHDFELIPTFYSHKGVKGKHPTRFAGKLMRLKFILLTSAIFLSAQASAAESFQFWPQAEEESDPYSGDKSSTVFMGYGWVLNEGVVFLREPTDRSFTCYYHSQGGTSFKDLVDTIGVNVGGMDGCPVITAFTLAPDGIEGEITYDDGNTLKVVLAASSEVQPDRAQVASVSADMLGLSLGETKIQIIEKLATEGYEASANKGGWIDVKMIGFNNRIADVSLSFDDQDRLVSLVAVTPLGANVEAGALKANFEARFGVADTKGTLFFNQAGKMIGANPLPEEGCNENVNLGVGYGLFDFKFPFEPNVIVQERHACFGGVEQQFLMDAESEAQVRPGDEASADYHVLRVYDASYRYARFKMGLSNIGRQLYGTAIEYMAD